MQTVGVKKLHTLTGHRDAVYALQPSDQPSVFFSGAGDGMVVQWDLRDPAEGIRIAQLPNSIYAMHYAPSLDILIVGHNYEGIHLLDWRNKKEIGSLKISGAAIFDIQTFGKDCFVASGEGTISVIDLEMLSLKKTLSFSAKNARTLAINPAGELAAGYSDNFIRVFDLADYSLKHEWQAHDNSVFSLAFTPGFGHLLSGSRDAHLKSWRPADNYAGEQDIPAHLYAINHIAFGPDGKHFVTCSMDKSVKVWDADLTLLKVIDKARHAGHGTSVNKLLWTPFNNQLVSASDDRTLSIWDVIF